MRRLCPHCNEILYVCTQCHRVYPTGDKFFECEICKYEYCFICMHYFMERYYCDEHYTDELIKQTKLGMIKNEII